MILVDSNILISAIRGALPQFRSLPPHAEVVVCGVCRAELLAGAKSPQDARRLSAFLSTYRQVETPESVWERAGAISASLRQKGIQIGLSDAIIAALAMTLDATVWTQDRDFLLIADAHPQLRILFEERTPRS